MDYFRWLVYLLGALAIVLTILPLWPGRQWWVRAFDFPRFQIAIMAALVMVLAPIAGWPLDLREGAFLAGVGLSLAWQLSWVWHYVPLAPREVEATTCAPDAPERIALLTTNVLQTSRGHDALLRIISRVGPDLVLAVETDEWWCSRLNEGLSARYPHRLLYPLSNGYGMALFSRLHLIEPSIRFIVDDAIPSIKARVQLRTGAQVDLYGMHPKPPAPQQDTTQRDVELVMIGTEISNAGRPAIVLGDLNDVAWSPTTLVFKETGGLVDPRRGRGFYNTYPAAWPGFRYPLDYVFHTPHFSICSMEVLPEFGSDHLPLAVTLKMKT